MPDEERLLPDGALDPGSPESSLGDDGSDFVITDTTPDVQLEHEATLLRGDTITDDGDPTDRSDAAWLEDRPPEAETAPPPSDGPAPLPGRTYTQAEYDQMRREVQSARDREVEQYRQQAFRQELEADREARVEAYMRQLTRQLVQSGKFDEEEAREQVFTEANRNQLRREYELNLERQVVTAQQQSQVVDMEQRQAYDLLADRIRDIKGKLKLEDQDVKMLLTQVPPRWESPEHFYRFENALSMQALSLYKRRGRGRVPNGDGYRQPTTGRSSGAAENASEKRMRIMQKASWEWTPEEYDLMRKQDY